ncbi:MAG TPA: hypothetical protein VI603_10720 [Saprospiraceae bacterium]|nr:hypothetical protein [Saprospiraceae bacterium]
MRPQPKRRSTIVKYLAIQKRYRELYEQQRLRHDDVIKQLCQEFFIAHPNTIYNILATDILDDSDSVHEDPDDES